MEANSCERPPQPTATPPPLPPARIFTNHHEILEAVQPDLSRPVRYTDCRVLTRYPGAIQDGNDYYVSSPNINFVPQLPIHDPMREFGYFADGMLGPFELTKWPQTYDQIEPHLLATPCNPGIIAKLETPLVDEAHELWQYEDPQAAWFPFTHTDVQVSASVPSADVGTLRTSVVQRLQHAVMEACAVIEVVISKHYPTQEKDPYETKVWKVKRSTYAHRLCATLKRALHKLSEALSQNERPQWMTAESPGWAAALMAEPQLHITHPTKPLLYVLPPVHLFYSSSPVMGSKVHNWLRIRQWCLIRAINPPLHGKTLMTTPQWRIVLDGKYWRVPLDRLGDVHPKSTSAEIQALPLPPLAEHRNQNTKKADRRSRQRLADRIDINVTFGVHRGFIPYDPTLDHSTWGGRVISHDEADRDEQLWAEITWELSVINF
ncbi:hypothetical protein WOLCODRAFT_148482 [Wolfiporia cocos MD-104 SS10]|uniref:Uncharacterized protein n=1 Tax=Wolfiporia cocos (strain MD-104) TaxID=742152 RepID=A0A2H3IWR1_WOLCO|nr:hypothetical protein WOLCODRAFT_148482 [Wolfiporia cocos MD-104 SS10]